MNAPNQQSTEAENPAPDLEVEVDEAIRICSGDVRAALKATLGANAYLEAKVERLTEAISTDFARGRMRRPPQRVKI
jgi:Tfp pilus assembly protein FimV